MKSVGIDIGTTTISVVVIDTSDLAVVQKHTVKHKGFLPAEHPWMRIQDPQDMIDLAGTMLEEILNSFDDVSVIGLTGQMHGTHLCQG